MFMDRYILYETYRLALLIDLVSPEELIAQLDAFIAERPVKEIPHAFYILSLTRNRRLMIEMLTDLAKGVDQSLPSFIVAGVLALRQEQYTTMQLYAKAGMLASLLADSDEDLVFEFRMLGERYAAAQQAYGTRFKRKKTRERVLEKNGLELQKALAKYVKYAEHFDLYSWES